MSLLTEVQLAWDMGLRRLDEIAERVWNEAVADRDSSYIVHRSRCREALRNIRKDEVILPVSTSPYR